MIKYHDYKIWGKYGLFTDPATKTGGDKSTYRIPTNEALKAITGKIYWKPTFNWYIDCIKILSKIKTTSRGVKSTQYKFSEEEKIKNKTNELFYYTYLENPKYAIKAHFEFDYSKPEFANDRDPGKHSAIMDKKIRIGGTYTPFLGTSDCQAFIEECNYEEEVSEYQDLPDINFGLMFHSFEYKQFINGNGVKYYKPVKARFWEPIMRNGEIKFIRPEECKIIKEME